MDQTEINVEYEYELIDFAWSMEYDFEEGETGSLVRDEGETPEEEATPIEFDENGIPKGQSKKEIKMRESYSARHKSMCNTASPYQSNKKSSPPKR